MDKDKQTHSLRSRANNYLETHVSQTLLSLAVVLLLGSYLYFYYLVRGEGLAGFAVLLLGIYGIAVLLCIYCLGKKGVAFEKLFLILLVTSGLAYMAIFAPMKAPDEQSHFAGAYRYSNFILGDEAFGSDLFLRSDDEDELHYWWIDHRKLSDDYHDMSGRFSLFADNTEMVKYRGNPQYVTFSVSSRPPQVHIFAALGITLARLVGLGAIPLIYFGRLFAFAAFSVCAYFAVRITPVAKRAFAGIFLLPIVLQLATSYSYDGPIIALAMLYGACCLNAIFADGPIPRWELARLAVVAALLAPCKLMYTILVPIVLFIPKRRFCSLRVKTIGCGVVCLSAALSLIFVSAPTILSVLSIGDTSNTAATSAPAHNSSGAPDDPDYKPSMTLSDAAADPIHTIGMALNTAYKESDIHVDGFFGGLMAWGKDLPGPRYIVLIFAGLFCASLMSECAWKEITPLVRLACIGLFLIGCAGIYASMLSGWTAVGSEFIYGIQGRYFLPLSPLLILIFGGFKRRVVCVSDSFLVCAYAYALFFYSGYLANIMLML